MQTILPEIRPAAELPGIVDAQPAPPIWLSLVLATVGRSEELRTVLDSLAAQQEQGFEVIVVDQNPDDRLAPILAEQRGLTIRHLRRTERNLSAARNAGLTAARGDWVGFPDDDCWYEPDSLAAVRRHLDRVPTLGGLVARWVEAEPSGPRAAHQLKAAAWRDFRGGDASSITLFLPRESVRASGSFDARIGVGQYYGAGEETDLLLRLLEHEAPIMHVPDVRVHHVFSPRSRCFA